MCVTSRKGIAFPSGVHPICVAWFVLLNLNFYVLYVVIAHMIRHWFFIGKILFYIYLYYKDGQYSNTSFMEPMGNILYDTMFLVMCLVKGSVNSWCLPFVTMVICISIVVIGQWWTVESDGHRTVNCCVPVNWGMKNVVIQLGNVIDCTHLRWVFRFKFLHKIIR